MNYRQMTFDDYLNGNELKEEVVVTVNDGKIEEYDLARRIALSYVQNGHYDYYGYYYSDCSIKSLCEDYGISKNKCNKLLELAVTKCLVSDDIVDRMENRAISNQKRHNSRAGRSSENKYDRLRKEGDEYAHDLILAFALSLESASDFAKKHGRTVENLKRFVSDVLTNPEKRARYDISSADLEKFRLKLLIVFPLNKNFRKYFFGDVTLQKRYPRIGCLFLNLFDNLNRVKYNKKVLLNTKNMFCILK